MSEVRAFLDSANPDNRSRGASLFVLICWVGFIFAMALATHAGVSMIWLLIVLGLPERICACFGFTKTRAKVSKTVYLVINQSTTTRLLSGGFLLAWVALAIYLLFAGKFDSVLDWANKGFASSNVLNIGLITLGYGFMPLYITATYLEEREWLCGVWGLMGSGLVLALLHFYFQVI